MEIRDFAERVLFAEELDTKLAFPPELTDDRPGPPIRVALPGRPRNLEFVDGSRAPRMPKGHFHEPRLRGVAHHIMANHELQALEAMAAVLLAYPDAPTDFRLEMVPILVDEQRHARMHARRAAEHGVPFGSLPVNGYVWKHSLRAAGLLDYLAAIPLTLEGGNLDHTLEFAARFAGVADQRSAGMLRSIHEDEIGHVAFGVRWLRRLKDPRRSDWEAYLEHLPRPLAPLDAVGRSFDAASRLRAGLDQQFVDKLAGQCSERTQGSPTPTGCPGSELETTG